VTLASALAALALFGCLGVLACPLLRVGWFGVVALAGGRAFASSSSSFCLIFSLTVRRGGNKRGGLEAQYNY
jgi:hypothetical protein